MHTLLFLLYMVPGTFFLGLNDVLIKKVLNTGVRPEFLVALNFFMVGLVGLALAFVVGIPELKPPFWSAFVVTVAVNILAQLAFYKAFQCGDASFVSAMRLITPPLVIITGFFILGEVPSLVGIVGVLTTIIGLWLLVGQSFSKGLSWHERIRQPAFLYALAGAVGFAVSFPFDKQALLASSTLFFVGLGFFSVGVGNLVLNYALAKNRGSFFHMPKEALPIMLMLIPVHSLGSYMTMQALTYSLAAYAASVKRLWSLWGVLLSGAILKEKNIGHKLLAVLIMLFGIFLTVAGDYGTIDFLNEW